MVFRYWTAREPWEQGKNKMSPWNATVHCLKFSGHSTNRVWKFVSIHSSEKSRELEFEGQHPGEQATKNRREPQRSSDRSFWVIGEIYWSVNTCKETTEAGEKTARQEWQDNSRRLHKAKSSFHSHQLEWKDFLIDTAYGSIIKNIMLQQWNQMISSLKAVLELP